MEDVCAIKVVDRERGVCGFLTWGRVYDAVDESKLLAVFRRVLPTMGFHEIDELSVCYDLGEVQNYRYFYEGLLSFARQMATEPYENEDWQRAQRKDEILRRSVFLIGPPRPNVAIGKPRKVVPSVKTPARKRTSTKTQTSAGRVVKARKSSTRRG